VGRRKHPIRRKTRTRDHVIADLAVNHVERQVLLCGHTLEEMRYDYGIDLVLFAHSPSGELENGILYIQVKATDRPSKVAGGTEIAFSVERADLLHWLNDKTPVILIVYDGREDKAWWLHMQGHFRGRPAFNIFRAGKTVRVRIPCSQVVTPEAIRHIVGLIHQGDSPK
jgi:hypothetical protein